MSELIENKRLQTLWTCFSILLGNALLAFLVAAFVLPHGVMMGGVTGIAIILNRFLPLDTASIVLILNLLALSLGGLVLGRKFLLKTIASSLLYPVLLGWMQRIPGITEITENTQTASAF